MINNAQVSENTHHGHDPPVDDPQDLCPLTLQFRGGQLLRFEVQVGTYIVGFAECNILLHSGVGLHLDVFVHDEMQWEVAENLLSTSPPLAELIRARQCRALSLPRR